MSTHQHGLFGHRPDGYDDDDDIFFNPRHQPSRRELPKRPAVKLNVSLKDLFNKEVKKEIAAYKHLQGRFIFVNEPEGQIISDIERGKTALRYSEQVEQYAAITANKARRYGSSLAQVDLSIKLEGAYWDDVRRRMKERGDQLAKEGVLLGMPHKNKPPSNDDKPAPPKKGWGFGKI